MNTTQRSLIAAISLCVVVAAPSIALAVAVSGQGTWETTLQGRDLDGNLATTEAYFDTALEITWLADANYGAGSIYDDEFGVSGGTNDGRTTWVHAKAWAANLDVNGVTGWRLPNINDVGNDGGSYINVFQGVDFGYNITVLSEMSHLFYITLGNMAFYTTSGAGGQPGWGLTNTGPFSNIQSDIYWSDMEYATNTTYAWFFDFFYGGQFSINKEPYDNYAWAVHEGDVGAAIPSAVPVPTAAWLFGSGLLGLVGVSRRKAV